MVYIRQKAYIRLYAFTPFGAYTPYIVYIYLWHAGAPYSIDYLYACVPAACLYVCVPACLYVCLILFTYAKWCIYVKRRIYAFTPFGVYTPYILFIYIYGTPAHPIVYIYKKRNISHHYIYIFIYDTHNTLIHQCDTRPRKTKIVSFKLGL